MSFTQDDCRKEILLKIMIAEAWGRTDPPSPPSQEDREVIQDWMTALCVEGPECGRVRSLMENPIDSFQAEMFDSELKAMLHMIASGGGEVKATLDRMLGKRKKIFDLESRLARKIASLVEDRSGIEQLLNKFSRAAG
ncbi:MAG: hypothetical protein RIF32_23780 [Leptospirales bacterium]|jgi:hypothetical protein